MSAMDVLVETLRRLEEDHRRDLADFRERADVLRQEVLRNRDEVREGLARVEVEVHDLRTQVSEQNGRVRRLELWRHGLEAVTRAHSWVKPAVIGAVTTLLVTIAGGLLQHYW